MPKPKPKWATRSPPVRCSGKGRAFTAFSNGFEPPESKAVHDASFVADEGGHSWLFTVDAETWAALKVGTWYVITPLEGEGPRTFIETEAP